MGKGRVVDDEIELDRDNNNNKNVVGTRRPGITASQSKK